MTIPVKSIQFLTFDEEKGILTIAWHIGGAGKDTPYALKFKVQDVEVMRNQYEPNGDDDWYDPNYNEAF